MWQRRYIVSAIAWTFSRNCSLRFDKVDQMELIAQTARPIITAAPGKRKFVAAADLTDLFGIEFDEPLAPERAETLAKSVQKGKGS
jgi:hypothetical protein